MLTTIYSSEKSLPYTYFGFNYLTGEFYFGYRKENTNVNRPSHLDLGVKYFTSSQYIKPRFNEFYWIILAEFLKWEDAYDFEQQLIAENISNPKCLNKHYTKNGKLRFSPSGKTKETDESIAKTAAKLTGRTKENDPGRKLAGEKISAALTGRTKETHPYIEEKAKKLRGRTKQNHFGIAQMAEKHRGKKKPGVSLALTGRTKETHAHLAVMAKKLTGRSKETHEYIAIAAEKQRGRTKDTHSGVAQMAESLNVLSKEHRLMLIEQRDAGQSMKDIHQLLLNDGAQVAITSLYGIYKRVKQQMEFA